MRITTKITVICFIMALMMFSVFPVQAQDAETVAPPAALKDAFMQEGEIVEFMGHAYGLDGWRISSKASNTKYLYTTKEGGVVAGLLFSPDGKMLTRKQSRALDQKTGLGSQAALPGAEDADSDFARIEKIYAMVENSAWVQFGPDTAPYMYVFVNLHCGHCQDYWQDLESAVSTGQLQVRLVPFGKLEQNRNAGAALLSVEEPLPAWESFLAGDETVLAEDKIKPGRHELMDKNTALFTAWKMQGPPFTLYRRPLDGEIMAIVGRSENMMAILADLMKKE